MKLRKFILAAALTSAASLAQAGYHYVGSWEVDDGQNWTTVPEAYTGQEAAALLFGGSASDYVISTISNQVADIDNLAWISTWGGACGGSFPCGTKVAENFEVSTAGLYQNLGDTSTFVDDWAIGATYTNYAFKVPEPASLALLGLGLAGLSLTRRRQV